MSHLMRTMYVALKWYIKEEELQERLEDILDIHADPEDEEDAGLNVQWGLREVDPRLEMTDIDGMDALYLLLGRINLHVTENLEIIATVPTRGEAVSEALNRLLKELGEPELILLNEDEVAL